ncbi:MAG TPA: hypothetical protein VF519_13930 [Mycobacteriales bacterium]|jgi:hypothetical protein
MRRSLAVAALSGALVAAALPLLGSASAAACPVWTDPKDDSTTAGAPSSNLYDANLDITSASFLASPAELKAVFTTAKLSDGPSDAGDEFSLGFKVGDKELQIYSDRTLNGELPGNGIGVYNVTDDELVSGGSATYDVKASTVTITVPAANAAKALGAPLAGKSATAFLAETIDQVGGVTMFGYDDAASPAGTAVALDAGCGGATPGPGPKPTPTPSPTPTPGPSTPPAAGMPAGLPRAGCLHWTDPTGDGNVGNANVPNDPDLDLTGLTVRQSAGWLLAYLKVDKLGTGPTAADGHRFSFEFTFNKHLFTIAASQYKNAQSEQVREGLAATGRNGHMVQMSVDSVSAIGPAYVTGQVTPPYVASGAKAAFDPKSGFVTIGVPVADVEKYGQAPLAGALTGVNGKSTADYWRNSLSADTVAGAATDNWTVGDNKCFPQAVPTSLTLAVAKAANARTVTAKLTAAGTPLAGKTITWLINGKKVGTSVTSSAGTAVLKTAKPTQVVTAEFAGIADQYLASKATARV